MRRLPTVQIEGLRKTYVRRDDVARYLEQRTFAKTGYRYDAPDNASGPATRERPGPGTGGESHAVPTLLVRVMASASITVRTTKTGRRFVVRYRLGGRAYPVEHGGSF